MHIKVQGNEVYVCVHRMAGEVEHADREPACRERASMHAWMQHHINPPKICQPNYDFGDRSVQGICP